MADYVAITDSMVDPDAPLTSDLMYRLRDNPIAIAEAAPGAPSLRPGAFNTVAGSDSSAPSLVPPFSVSASAGGTRLHNSFYATAAGSVRVTSSAASATGGGSRVSIVRNGTILNEIGDGQSFNYVLTFGRLDSIRLRTFSSDTGGITVNNVAFRTAIPSILLIPDTRYLTWADS